MKNPFRKRSVTASAVGLIASGDVSVAGYTRLIDCPEVSAGVRWLCDLISTMTIHMMENRDNGDVRLHDDLARFFDIYPYRMGTRQTFISWIVKMLVTTGNAFCLPTYRDGILSDLTPMPEASAIGRDAGLSYEVHWKGSVFDPGSVLHFALDPDELRPWRGTGCNFNLLEIADSLRQATATKTAFMKSDYKPPLIVSVDAFADGMNDPAKRKQLVDSYVKGAKAGEPWIIPSQLCKVDSIRPLSLTDLAIKDGIELDRRTIAAVLGIPAYVLGVGSFSKDEYNTCIRTRVHAICTCIEQTLTTLLVSPSRYIKMNARSLYAYDIKELESMYSDLYVRGLATGNEVRDALGMSPRKGLDKLVILENYIPAEKIGDQKKLIQEANQNEQTP